MYVVIGASGYLGSYVIKAILDGTKEHVIATARNLDRVNRQERVEWISCNIRLENSVDTLIEKLSKYDNIKIVYLAAYHHPDLVEKNKFIAWDINVTCLSKFINKATFAKKIYYASTDSVYGESTDGYHFKESDALRPVNFYGHNKCVAEAIMIHLNRNVVRFPFLVSPSITYKPHFYDIIVEDIRNGKPFKMLKDSYRSSLSFENAGKLLISLMEKDNIPQIVNICGDKDMSKYDVGVLIAKREGISSKRIIPVSSDNQMGIYTTKRALSTLMDNNLLKQVLSLSSIDIFNEPKVFQQ